MKIKQLDFPYNLFAKIKLGKLYSTDKGEIIQDIILKETILFKLLRWFCRLWKKTP